MASVRERESWESRESKAASAEELQAELEELMAAGLAAAEQLAGKDEEIAALRERERELEAEARGAGRGAVVELRDEVSSLRARLVELEEQLERSLDSSREQQGRAEQLEVANRALRTAMIKLEGDVAEERRKVERAEECVHELHHESAERLDVRWTQRRELIKVQGVNEELRKEVRELRGAVQTLFQAGVEKDAALDQATEFAKTAAQDLVDLQAEADELRRALAERTTELQHAKSEVSAVMELEKEIEVRVHAKVDKYRARAAEAGQRLDKESARFARELTAMQDRVNHLMTQAGLREEERKLEVRLLEMQNQLAASEDKCGQRDKELAVERAHVARLDEELMTLARAHEELRADRGKLFQEEMRKEVDKTRELQAQVRLDQALVQEERERYKALEEDKVDLEERLQERESALADYERGHGLTELVVRQRQLRDDIKRRDKEIKRLNEEGSMRMESYDKLFEANRKLKLKAGLPEDYEFPGLEIDDGVKSSTERLAMLTKELEAQNEALETERLKHLMALRRQAVQLGDGKHFGHFAGLSAEQVFLVMEFAEQVRDGRNDLPSPMNAPGVLHQKLQQLHEYTHQLHKAVPDRDDARDKAGKVGKAKEKEHDEGKGKGQTASAAAATGGAEAVAAAASTTATLRAAEAAGRYKSKDMGADTSTDKLKISTTLGSADKNATSSKGVKAQQPNRISQLAVLYKRESSESDQESESKDHGTAASQAYKSGSARLVSAAASSPSSSPSSSKIDAREVKRPATRAA
jgi:chromosome segregation ATPase